MHLTENIVHGILNRTRDRTVYGRGGGFVLECTGIGGYASCRNRTLFQSPDKLLVPMLALAVSALDFSQCARHPFKGIVDRVINTIAILGLEAILLVPYVQRRLLQGQTSKGVLRIGIVQGQYVNSAHLILLLRLYRGESNRDHHI